MNAKAGKQNVRSREPKPSSSEDRAVLYHHKAPASKLGKGENRTTEGTVRRIGVRIIAGICMIAGFITILLTSHEIVALFVVLLQIGMFREIVNINHHAAKEKGQWGIRVLNWYFMTTALYFVYGRGVWTYLRDYVPDRFYHIVYHHHLLHSFILHMIGFVGFIFSLHGQTLRYQIRQITWVFVTILNIFVQCHFIVENIYRGLIWFILPHSLIICNDVFAYITGLTLGRKFINRPLIKLSPKKTWEGFIGGLIATIIAGIIGSRYLASFSWFRCSKLQLKESGTCPVSHLFTPVKLQSYLGFRLPSFLSDVTWMPMQSHSIAFSLFASLVAPFGGFLASAVKRAYQKKDFDTLIPGHGGITDRFDCQLLVGLFIHVYYVTFIKSTFTDIEAILLAISALPPTEQLQVYSELSKHVSELHVSHPAPSLSS
ncbi:probable phosphatidate cytidylyltransferase isoform X2 [Schistocerca gregaria]|uniref:probable phosphatidate cytidylyltransferase isoform X2 n=1 Tax=Schistocerca gregaria TaxID=7010 RepID=UPI00211E61BC|nr:probable phosphatidate cytidylyltransferase isoform X2 [Schistocerca gregaria]